MRKVAEKYIAGFDFSGHVVVAATESGDVPGRLREGFVSFWGEKVYEIRHTPPPAA